MTGASGSLVMASLVNSRTLCNTVVVALPDDVGVCRERKQALDRFSGIKLDIPHSGKIKQVSFVHT